MLKLPAIFLLWLVWSQLASALRRGDQIPLYYDKIYSSHTQLTFPYSSLPFICPPYIKQDWSQVPRHASWLILDQDLRGDHPVSSNYKIRVLEDSTCNTLCSQSWSAQDAKMAKELISNDYQNEWWLDGLPSATAWYTNTNAVPAYRIGFPLGYRANGKTYINNHILFKIRYTADKKDPDDITIVGFEVYPDSLQGERCERVSMVNELQEVAERSTTVTFSYSILWNKVTPGTPLRWDMYLALPDLDAHHVATVANTIIVILLQGVVATILKKTLYKSTHGQDNTGFKLPDDTDNVIGWRLLHSDILRRPLYGGLLTPVIGSGIQFLVIALTQLGALSLSLNHPAKPGSMLRWTMLAALPGGALGGYWSGRIYKGFSRRSWGLNALLTSCLVPGCVIGCVALKCLFAWTNGSSLAISFGGWAVLLAWWTFLACPLIIGGAYLGERHGHPEHPTRTKHLAREIPKKKWYQRSTTSMAVGGVIQFGIVFVNLEELFRFLWQGEYYLTIKQSVDVCALLGVTAAEVTFVLVFFQLCSEDYRWWWTAFAIGASPSLYMFAYGMTYYAVRTDIRGLFGLVAWTVHLALCCGFIGLCTGTLGFLSAYFMIRKIYAVVKVD